MSKKGPIAYGLHKDYAKLILYVLFSISCGSEMYLHGKSICSWCDGSSDQSFMVDPLSYFLFEPVHHNWCNKDHGMCYPVCGMMHIKELLLLIGKSSLCGRFPLLLSGLLLYD